MIKQWILHIEFHRGYRPRVSFRRVPRAGSRTIDGGIPGTIVPCRECGHATMFQPDAGFPRMSSLAPRYEAQFTTGSAE